MNDELLDNEKSLKEKIDELIAEKLETDRKLPTEKEMMERFGVSRSLLREVLITYEASGIIKTIQGSGRYVEMPNFSKPLFDIWSILVGSKPTLLFNLLEIRSILEINSLEKAMQYIEVKQLQLMKNEVVSMKEKSAMGQSFAVNDREFHRVLFSSTKNILLEQLLTAFWDLYELAKIENYHKALPVLAQQHEDLLVALTQEDIETATNLLKEQFNDARYQIKTALIG